MSSDRPSRRPPPYRGPLAEDVLGVVKALPPGERMVFFSLLMDLADDVNPLGPFVPQSMFDYTYDLFREAKAGWRDSLEAANKFAALHSHLQAQVATLAGKKSAGRPRDSKTDRWLAEADRLRDTGLGWKAVAAELAVRGHPTLKATTIAREVKRRRTEDRRTAIAMAAQVAKSYHLKPDDPKVRERMPAGLRKYLPKGPEPDPAA